MVLWVQKGLDFERSHFHRTSVYGRDNSKRALESPLNRGDEALWKSNKNIGKNCMWIARVKEVFMTY